MDRFAAMEAFVRVVDARSFSKAAHQLRRSQPAISKAITALEERLGVTLLLRSTHGLTPTEAGISFYEKAKAAIEMANAAEQTVSGTVSGVSGRLCIGAAVTFGRLHLVPLFSNLLAENPQIKIDLLLDDGNVDLVAAGIDVAVRMGDLRDSSLTARRIGQARRHVVGTPAYFASGGGPANPADLGDYEAILYDRRGGGASWTFRRNDESVDVTLKGRLNVSAAEGVREAVFAGLGFSIASDWMFSDALRSGLVVAALTDWTLPPLDLWAVWPGDRRLTNKASLFVSLLAKAMEHFA